MAQGDFTIEAGTYLVINPADKTRLFAIAVGDGLPGTFPKILSDVYLFTIGSQYTDITAGKVYIRKTFTAPAGDAADWVEVGA